MELSEQLLQLRDKLLTIPHFEDTYKEAIREGGVFDKLLGIWTKESEFYKSTKALVFSMMYGTAPHATAKLLVVAYAINNPEKFFDTPEEAETQILAAMILASNQAGILDDEIKELVGMK